MLKFLPRKKNITDLFEKVRTEDLMRFGLIPEFLGRLPVLCALAMLDEDALINILTQPKNAIIKQFQKLFEFENVELKFSEGALRAVVKEALFRKTGARGLRAILEENMLDIMYDMPGQEDLKEIVITEEVIVSQGEPICVYRSDEEKAEMKAKAEAATAEEPLKEGNDGDGN